MSALERNPQFPAPTPHKVLGPGINGRGIPRGPRASSMGIGLSWGHQSGSLRSPSKVESTCRNSRKSRRFSSPGEMRPISAEPSPGKSHLTSGTSKGSFSPLLQLKKFPDIPVSTREEARESRPHPEEPRFRLLGREEGTFPCVFGKEFPAFPSHVKRRRSPQERREELQGRGTIPRDPEMSQSIPGKPVFPALPRLSSRGSTYTTVARGTALWESLVGMPLGKASRESLVGKPRGKATDPLIHEKGSVTLLLQLGRKAPVHAPTRDED